MHRRFPFLAFLHLRSQAKGIQSDDASSHSKAQKKDAAELSPRRPLDLEERGYWLPASVSPGDCCSPGLAEVAFFVTSAR
jgi:hypothetical protein